MKKVYISLPISGHNLDDVRKRIQEASELLRTKGYIPVSPLEIQADLNAPYSELMGNDIKALLECDAIIFLDGWENSKGCQLEHRAAILYNKPVFVKKSELQHLYCSKCGYPHPQSLAWLDSNTHEFIKWNENDMETDTDWCPQCRETMQAMNIIELYNEFVNVPVNDNGKIMKDFICFPTGTLATEVMSWLDKRCPDDSHDDYVNDKTINYEVLCRR